MENLREKYKHDFLEGGHTGTGILTWRNENILQTDITADDELTMPFMTPFMRVSMSWYNAESFSNPIPP